MQVPTDEESDWGDGMDQWSLGEGIEVPGLSEVEKNLDIPHPEPTDVDDQWSLAEGTAPGPSDADVEANLKTPADQLSLAEGIDAPSLSEVEPNLDTPEPELIDVEDDIENQETSVAEDGVEIQEHPFVAQNCDNSTGDEGVSEEGIEAPSLDDVELLMLLDEDYDEGESKDAESAASPERQSTVVIADSGDDVESNADVFVDDCPQVEDTNSSTKARRTVRRQYRTLLVWLVVVVGIVCVIIGFNQRAKNEEGTTNSVSKAVTGASGVAGQGSESGTVVDDDQGASAGAGEIDPGVTADAGATGEGATAGAGETGQVDGVVDSGSSNSDSESATTDSPTDATTLTPTASPVVQCLDEILSLKSCYTYRNDPITVTFTQCDPRDEDWIGIYPSGSDALSLGDQYLGWSYACEDEDCEGASVVKDSLELIDVLPPGQYQLFLVLDNPDGSPYRSVASSEPFEIGRTCS